MNILLSDVCNRRCNFCFAKGIHEHKGKKFIDFDDFKRVVDFSFKSNRFDIRLLGGEPSLHPQFIQIIEYLSDLPQLASVYLMTNGIMSSDKIDALLYLRQLKHLEILCNVSHQAADTEHQLTLRDNFLKTVNASITLSNTIYNLDLNLDYYVDLIEKFELHRRIRLGIAHKLYGCYNQFLNPALFKAVNITIDVKSKELAAKNIFFQFDCGHPLCHIKHTVSQCLPIIDVGVNLDVWSCFPLKEFEKRKLFDFEHLNDVVSYFVKKLEPYHSKSIFDECDTCSVKNQCCKGCVAHKLP